ncbi:hypothetical protein OAG94_02490 [bacterium]|nr:hypothetical protein [bacterium]
MLTSNGQNGKAKLWLESRLEGEPGGPLLGLRNIKILAIVSSKSLHLRLHTEQAINYSSTLL